MSNGAMRFSPATRSAATDSRLDEAGSSPPAEVAAQRDNVANPRLPVLLRNLVHLLTCRIHTGQMCRRHQASLLHDPCHCGMGPLPRLPPAP